MTLNRKSAIVLAIAAWCAMAADQAGALAADDAPGDKIPLKKIVLFNSGVGYFEHSGSIEGNRSVDLKFNVDDINDLLKSLVLQDLGGGRISTVTYGSKDPIERTLQTFAIDLTTSPTLPDILRQVRGEEVEIEAPDKIAGTIVGVETRKQQVGKDEVIEVHFLNLLTKEGLRSIALSDVGRIKLVNEALDREFRQALQVLATAHSTDKKSVTLNFLGEGKRDVAVAYILESPIWKTSYRLVLGDKEPAKLQGWAIVENVTEEDWNEVELTLVSGRPISFVMDLYEPLYVSRPVVEPELFASLRPPTYDQDMASKEKEFAKLDRRRLQERKAGEALAEAPAAPSVAPGDGGAGGFGGGGMPSKPGRNSFEGVESAAQAGQLGELFHYSIQTPVSLARQRSAMLPIVNGPVEAKKVSIYNAQVHPKHPLNGLRLKNTTELHLMQGPITVFDQGAYAGDSRIEDLPPGSERLISYAMDLDTEVAVESKPHPTHLASVKFVKGTLHVLQRNQREAVYTIKNSGDEKAEVVIEYPIEPQWRLVQPANPNEKTRSVYRFVVHAEPGQPATLAIEEEMPIEEVVAVSNMPDDMVQVFLRAPTVSDKVKEALAEVVKRRQELAAVSGKLAQITQQREAITAEQSRIRQNMATLDKNNDLYRRYVKKFNEQEDQVEGLVKQFEEVSEQVRQLQAALDGYIAGLDLS